MKSSLGCEEGIELSHVGDCPAKTVQVSKNVSGSSKRQVDASQSQDDASS